MVNPHNPISAEPPIQLSKLGQESPEVSQSKADFLRECDDLAAELQERAKFKGGVLGKIAVFIFGLGVFGGSYLYYNHSIKEEIGKELAENIAILEKALAKNKPLGSDQFLNSDSEKAIKAKITELNTILKQVFNPKDWRVFSSSSEEITAKVQSQMEKLVAEQKPVSRWTTPHIIIGIRDEKDDDEDADQSHWKYEAATTNEFISKALGIRLDDKEEIH